MDAFRIPAGPSRSTLEIRRSQFITCVDHTPGADAARAYIDTLRQQYPDANHHCYAYVAGAPDNVYLIDKSDDGEPRGTAGRPILNVLQHAGIGEITVVVVRYFGGIKLGAGGLVRAYSQCASAALASLETREFVRKESVKLHLPYSLLDRTEHYLCSAAADVRDRRFDASVCLMLDVPRSNLQQFFDDLQAIGQGAITWTRSDESAD